MLRGKRLRLVTLGELALLDDAGQSDESLATRPRKLALLVVLALARRPLTRDALVGMFWGEQDESRARHSLSDALSHLRRALGADAFTSNGASVSLAEDVPLDVDVLELDRAANAGDHPSVTRLYRGHFLESVHTGSSESFDRWAEHERRRLELLFLRSAAVHCEILLRTGRSEERASLASRWLNVAPTSVDAAIHLLEALSAPGTRESGLRALAEYERLSRRLADEYVLAPERPVVELAERIREQAHQTLELPVPAQPVGQEIAVGATPWRRRWVAGMAVSLAVIAAALVVGRLRFERGVSRASAATERPLAAIVPFEVPSSDTTLGWLSDGLPHMMATALARVSSLDVVQPKRVRDVGARVATGGVPGHTVSELTTLGRGVGASVVVNGQLYRRDSLLVLELGVHDVTSGRAVRLHTLSSANVLSLADEAAARVLAAVDDRVPGPRLLDLETSSVEAYQQYVHAVALADMGRGAEATRAVDAAIARDSGFVSALYFRARLATDPATRSRLRQAMKRYGSRATEWDRLELQAYDANFAGERGRAEALARRLVMRFPRDPRGYRLLATLLDDYGRWPEADSVMQAVLALDSLGMEAGRGPCAPCVGYQALSDGRVRHGDPEGALRAARRLVELQPNIASGWVNLGWILAYRREFDQSIAAVQRASALAQEATVFEPILARIYILSRRFAEADALIRQLRRSTEPIVLAASFDLRSLLQRERGQLRLANAGIDTLAARGWVHDNPSLLMKAHALGRLGDATGAIRLFERYDHGASLDPVSLSAESMSAGQRARAFSWHHALEADAIAAIADTMYLRALADSVERIGAQSYYGRDRRLHHHIRGLIAARAGRHEDAVRAFGAARWEVGGWSRTNIEMARSLLALGRTSEALDVLRQAYVTQLDGMGRYAPRSEIDYWMARAFTAAGARDSADVYDAYVRRAWTHADPEVRRDHPLPD